MPQRFRFEVNENGVWVIAHEAILNSQRCLGHGKKGRCKRKCIIGFEYCPTHLEIIKKLKIKPSTIQGAGKGLFVSDKTKAIGEVVFFKHSKVADYNGVIKTRQQLTQQYRGHTAPYAVELVGNSNIDAADKRSVGSLVNHKELYDEDTDNPIPMRVQNDYANCVLARERQNRRVVGIYLKAIRDIRNGEELFASYGDEYDFEEEDEVRYSTKPYYKRK